MKSWQINTIWITPKNLTVQCHFKSMVIPIINSRKYQGLVNNVARFRNFANVNPGELKNY